MSHFHLPKTLSRAQILSLRSGQRAFLVNLFSVLEAQEVRPLGSRVISPCHGLSFLHDHPKYRAPYPRVLERFPHLAGGVIRNRYPWRAESDCHLSDMIGLGKLVFRTKRDANRFIDLYASGFYPNLQHAVEAAKAELRECSYIPVDDGDDDDDDVNADGVYDTDPFWGDQGE